ncbi:multiubiquitin domain-containing protein [Nitrolancea hollandica]|uniref:Multi-ubiquitin domain-containing protein n=1 Tax=Nitrolancea hollandica Lb TaxID=1129897 RepID=I4EKV0_9BACT|nr:multiubiquitin domain-containing protein [Nitrolancea hollandica]CCF85312.1 hypothetical protein NITHO_480010 [Nitrolancea hollandica Lb]
MPVSTKLHVFVNRKKVDVESAELTGEQLLTAAGLSPQEWDLFRLQGEGDPTGGTQVGIDEVITVKQAEHFRAVPANRNYGGA